MKKKIIDTTSQLSAWEHTIPEDLILLAEEKKGTPLGRYNRLNLIQNTLLEQFSKSFKPITEDERKKMDKEFFEPLQELIETATEEEMAELYKGEKFQQTIDMVRNMIVLPLDFLERAPMTITSALTFFGQDNVKEKIESEFKTLSDKTCLCDENHNVLGIGLKSDLTAPCLCDPRIYDFDYPHNKLWTNFTFDDGQIYTLDELEKYKSPNFPQALYTDSLLASIDWNIQSDEERPYICENIDGVCQPLFQFRFRDDV